MSCPLYIVDAFAHAPFSGNPAAVCVLDTARPEQWMQQVAAEMNLSETAFTWPISATARGLRWFTPTCEVNLCGHATLATAHVLWQRGLTDAGIQFHTRSGPLTASRVDGGIALDFPADPPMDIEAEYREPLSRVIGAAIDWLSRGREDAVAVLATADAVRHLEPDLALLKSLPFRGLVVTAPGDENGVDCVSRFFAPAIGIPEDPVTGGAHCLLALYWGKRLGRTQVRGFQASNRTGSIMMDWRGDRVVLIGAARTQLTGEFHG